MLKVASFPITNADGINTLLTSFRLAEGAHILVSDGNVCIPYEDGLPPNKEQKTIAMREQQNKFNAQIADIEHSNKVLNGLIDEAKNRLETANADLEQAKTYKMKQHETAPIVKRIDATKSVIEQLESTLRQNEHELIRLRLNCKVYDEKIEELNA